MPPTWLAGYVSRSQRNTSSQNAVVSVGLRPYSNVQRDRALFSGSAAVRASANVCSKHVESQPLGDAVVLQKMIWRWQSSRSVSVDERMGVI
jgi:hypothetical protein